MGYLLIMFSVVSLIGSMYFFFYERSLLWGSITTMISIFMGIAYALMSTVNKLSDEEK